MHEGHRKRIIERLAAEEKLQDHELLEILLFNAIPRKNTNEIAHALLDAFGSVEGVLQAPVSCLMQVDGVGPSVAAYLRCVAAFCGRMSGEKKPETACAVSVSELSPLAIERLRGLKEEVIEAYCLDERDRIRFIKRFPAGTGNSVRLSPEKLSALLASQSPHALVLAHNHPSGPCDPSPEDDRFTAAAALICDLNNVRFFDHLIVSQTELYSYYDRGRMEAFRSEFMVDRLIEERGLR